MNVERMEVLAQVVEQKQEPARKFSMDLFCSLGRGLSNTVQVEDEFPCGTAFCIGGYACLLFGEKGDLIDEVTAMRVLDLDAKEAELFYRFEIKTRAEAAKAIRDLVEEYKVSRSPEAKLARIERLLNALPGFKTEPEKQILKIIQE